MEEVTSEARVCGQAPPPILQEEQCPGNGQLYPTTPGGMCVQGEGAHDVADNCVSCTYQTTARWSAEAQFRGIAGVWGED